MAEPKKESRLKLVFKNPADLSVGMSVPYVKEAIEAAEVKSLVQVILENGGVYASEPRSAVSAALVTTETKSFDLAISPRGGF